VSLVVCVAWLLLFVLLVAIVCVAWLLLFVLLVVCVA
jgi:hypothetical protein